MDTGELIRQLLGFLNEAVKSESRNRVELANEHLRRLQNCLNHYRPPKLYELRESDEECNGI